MRVRGEVGERGGEYLCLRSQTSCSSAPGTVYMRTRGKIRAWGARCECPRGAVCVGARKYLSVCEGGVQGQQVRFTWARRGDVLDMRQCVSARRGAV